LDYLAIVTISDAAESSVPMTNYGIAIAQMHGILRRSIQLFPDALAALEECNI
jgi:hypothetical protein